MVKVLLIPGHGCGDPGAVRLGYKEADLTRELVPLISKELSQYCEVHVADMSLNWYRYIITNGNRFNFKQYDYVLEVHFNIAAKDEKGNGITTGSEIYVTRAEKNLSVEQYILEGMKTFGFKNRGVKRKNYDLIYHIKNQGTSSALLEVCFMDDKDDMTLYAAHKNNVARKIAEGIAKGYKLDKNGLSSACRVLAEAGIINSPNYWAKGKGYSDANTVLLIEKFADYVRRKEM